MVCPKEVFLNTEGQTNSDQICVANIQNVGTLLQIRADPPRVHTAAELGKQQKASTSLGDACRLSRHRALCQSSQS